MHEASIAMSIIETAAKTAAENGCARVNSVSVRIGAAANIMVDALRFAFDAYRDELPATAGATLVVEHVPVGGICRTCGTAFETDRLHIEACPSCGAAEFSITSGSEMNIVEIDCD